MKPPRCTANGSALARVKPSSQASALRLCSPSLRSSFPLHYKDGRTPSALTLATPDLAGLAEVTFAAT